MAEVRCSASVTRSQHLLLESKKPYQKVIAQGAATKEENDQPDDKPDSPENISLFVPGLFLVGPQSSVEIVIVDVFALELKIPYYL